MNASAARIFTPPTPALFAADFDPGRVLDFHRRLPGYAPTPLVEAPALAAQLGVGRVWIKDESARLGLPAYKVLGAAWATYRALEQRVGGFAPWQTTDDLARQLRALRQVELVAATEGNHGRAVARMARWLGLPAHILLPTTAAVERATLIEREGARVTRVSGAYDDAVRAAAVLDGGDRIVISDTAWPGYEDIPRWVVEGYSTLFNEADAQLAAAGAPPADAVAVQMGVGALAMAVVKHYRQPTRAAQVIGVEPLRAACIFASLQAGHPVEVRGPYDPAMAGLNCGAPSPVAWPVISRGLSASLALPTERALAAADALAALGVSASPSAAAGLGGFFELLRGPHAAEHRARFGWGERTSLLAFATEGALSATGRNIPRKLGGIHDAGLWRAW